MSVFGLNWVVNPGGFRSAEVIVPQKLKTRTQPASMKTGQRPRRWPNSASNPAPKIDSGPAGGVKYRPDGSAPNGLRTTPAHNAAVTPARRILPGPGLACGINDRSPK